jgi:hypothetical protein
VTEKKSFETLTQEMGIRPSWTVPRQEPWNFHLAVDRADGSLDALCRRQLRSGDSYQNRLDYYHLSGIFKVV